MIFPTTKIKNRYRADSLLGRGGMGEVWRCFDESLNRNVVLKVVSPELAKSRPEHTSIFIDEARIGASLVGHPNVVTVFDILNEPHNDEPLLAIIMEYVEGFSCANWITNASSKVDGQTQYYISLLIAMETCKAVGYAHRHGIMHRDIKPLNIFISKYGATKIGDFGISRYADAVTREHTVWNFKSPPYSAPEQWEDKKPTLQTDIYQLACTLYHLFAGEPPYQATSAAALIQKHLNSQPVPPKSLNSLISDEFSSLIVRGLSKSPGERVEIWELTDCIAQQLHKTYALDLTYDNTDELMIKKINAITDFDEDGLKESGGFSWMYVDFNEAISEAMELTMLQGLKVKLSLKT